MSVRLFAGSDVHKSMQLFGNNDIPNEIFNFLKVDGMPESNFTLGYTYDECGTFDRYIIKDIQLFLDSLIIALKDKDQYLKDIYYKESGIFDLSGDNKWTISQMIHNHESAYINTIPNFINNFKGILARSYSFERNDYVYEYSGDQRIYVELY